MSETTKKKREIIVHSDGSVEIVGLFDGSLEKRKWQKAVATQCGHVKRRLNAGKPLDGKILEFALETLGNQCDSSEHGFIDGIAEKLKAGEELSEYEQHFFVDVILLHTRLGA